MPSASKEACWMQSHHLNLDVVDRDGALAEAAKAVAGDSRADFFRKAGAAAGGTLLASSSRTRASAPTSARRAGSRRRASS
jgi:hypothetical protein